MVKQQFWFFKLDRQTVSNYINSYFRTHVVCMLSKSVVCQLNKLDPCKLFLLQFSISIGNKKYKERFVNRI